MTVVNSKEFAINQEKYFDLAIREQVYVKRDNNMFLLVYSPNKRDVTSSRKGWDAAFAKYALDGEDTQLLPDFLDAEIETLL